MTNFKLRIITPERVVHEDTIESITAPGADGEMTVLYNHMPLFSLLKEGAVTIRKDSDDSYFSIGRGYLETNGREVNLLVSRAFGQDELDVQAVEKARIEAERRLKEAPAGEERHAAMLQLRRSLIDLKVLKLRKRRVVVQ